MTVLVTGASGFLGSWIARELVRASRRVRVLLRETSDVSNLEGLDIERAVGDVTDAGSIADALKGCDAVVHTAGVSTFEAAKTKAMYTVNVEGTRNVFAAARRAGVTRAVLTSSVAAMGGFDAPRVSDESTPSNADELQIPYFLSKLHGEASALESAGGGLHVTIVRPSVAMGPGDIYESSAAGFLLPLALRALPFYVDGGASFADVRDIAAGHVAALEKGRDGEVYILAGHNLATLELVSAVAGVTGVRAPKRAPYGLAVASATAVEWFSRAFRVHTSVTRDLVRASHLFTFVSSEKAKEALGYSTRPLATSLEDTFRYFLAHGRLAASTPELSALAARND